MGDIGLHALQAGLLQVGKSSIVLVELLVVFVPLERILPLRPGRIFYPGWVNDIGWYFLNALVVAFALAPLSAALALGIHRILPAGLTQAGAAMPLWLRMIASMVVGEIGFYWGHRWSHEIPLLWRFHAVHHSAPHITFLVNTRAHPVDLAFTRLCGLTLLYATGLAAPVGPHPPLIPALVLFVASLWSFLIHANVRIRLGWLEHVLSTPAFHHWHHTLEDHKDHNYAAMLPFADHLFGTFYLPRHWPAEYGTSTAVPRSLRGQFFAPFRASTSIPGGD